MTTETHYATGRRKTSSARIYLSSGKGNITVNDKQLDVYFGRKVAQMLVMQPLEMTELSDKLDINIKVKGGGSFGQAGAIRHGISRALISYDEELRPQLKKAGLLTRDPRKVERKKPGLVKARKRQYKKKGFNRFNKRSWPIRHSICSNSIYCSMEPKRKSQSSWCICQIRCFKDAIWPTNTSCMEKAACIYY